MNKLSVCNMKIVIGYPPIEYGKGIPFLGQNRQFQWGGSPWTAYPMVPAYAATLLKQAGHQVFWLDGICGSLTYAEWEKQVLDINPDVLMIETKTPVIKYHWKIIDNLKAKMPGCKIVLVGDHVTALPKESMRNCKVDYILTGGDYDFLLLNLCNHSKKGEALEPGIWHREQNGVEPRFTGNFVLNHNLDNLPFIDRDLTQWKLYAYKNSNYCRLPGTYTMFSRDCWWGKCSFCSWTTLYPGNFCRTMNVKRALNEIGHIIDNYPIKEIMDDSGTFPNGNWLREFCNGMINRGYNKRARINCNMRFNSGLSKQDYELMGKAGFRFLLYGLESVNQKTLDKINKNLKVEQIKPALQWAKQAGLNPHITVMVGYPWETQTDIKNTLDFSHKLFKKDLVDSLQATIVIPYPGTPLFEQAKQNNWLKTLDWERYDMSEPILKTEINDKEIKALVQGFYKSIFSFQFVLRKLKQGFSDFDIFRYYVRFGLKFFSKLLDFKK